MYVDADVLYAYLKPTDWLKEFTGKILKEKVITSSVTIMELEIVSKKDFDETFSNQVLERLKKIKNLEIANLDQKVLEKAVQLRKKHGLGIFDSIHVATALIRKRDIISSDLMFERVKELKRIDPREFRR